jgi:DNA-binding NarL/FixJ family response regulator/anti-sigma regulatory factor (Ser/Thr protein kinase)
LVIEDEAPLRQEILESLGFEGFEATGAENGWAGVQMARDRAPDLVICDIMMPELDGYGVLEALRSDSTTATTPFIFLTAKSLRDDMRRGMELGADDYITKPFSSTELLAAVRARLDRKMAEENRRLRALSNHLVEAQENERRHIARELHDEIGQILAGLQMVLGITKRMPPDAVKSRLDEVQALVNEMSRRVGELSLDLRPAMLDDLGLLPALSQLFERYTGRTQVRVDFRRKGLDGRLAPALETAVYRIVQEALTNVARHTSVTEATVQLRVDQETLSIEVADRGQGFDLERVLLSAPAAGLSGMQERAAALGGRLVIESSPGQGTRLAAELPLQPAAVETGDPSPLAVPAAASAPLHIERLAHPPGARSGDITIVLAEGHDLVRAGLRSLLETEPGFLVVGETGLGRQAVELVERYQPDVLVLDFNIPGASALDITRQLVRQSPRTHTLVLSNYTDQPYIIETIRSGAAGYALKETSADDLLQAVNEVAGGRRYLSPRLAERAVDYFVGVEQGGADDVFGTLTNREREVLHLVLDGLKNAEVAERLSISPRTVETHRANMMRKLGLRTQADLIRLALEHGLISTGK